VAGGADGIRYSALAQIDRSNGKKLQVAQRYHTGAEFKDSEMQCNPIVVDGVL
jgi:quinoprotein glucose dehydrogenase